MNWRKDRDKDQGRERGYHHGNLREALLQAALDLIGQKGAAGFTFADAARMAGVSPAAPYRHFRDRDELLSSIAQRGFEQFEAALSQAWDDGRPDTITAFERVGKAYLNFAREQPALYSAMFESGIPIDMNPALMAAGERAFAIVRAAAERLAALAPPGMPRPPAMMMALHIWSMSHGVASLFARGDAARRKLPMSPDELLEAEVLIYLRGLGFQTDRRAPEGRPPADEKPGASAGPPAGPWGKPK
jgi:AcrR family transcriptional regulator